MQVWLSPLEDLFSIIIQLFRAWLGIVYAAKWYLRAECMRNLEDEVMTAIRENETTSGVIYSFRPEMKRKGEVFDEVDGLLMLLLARRMPFPYRGWIWCPITA